MSAGAWLVGEAVTDLYRTIRLGTGDGDAKVVELPPVSLSDFRAIGWMSEWGEGWYDQEGRDGPDE